MTLIHPHFVALPAFIIDGAEVPASMSIEACNRAL